MTSNLTTMFENVQIQYDNNPIVLIDISGSTSTKVNLNDQRITILDYENQIVDQLMKLRNIRNFNLMYWSTNQEIIGNMKTDNYLNFCAEHNFKKGGTYLSPAIRNIPERWFHDTKNNINNDIINIKDSNDEYDEEIIEETTKTLTIDNKEESKEESKEDSKEEQDGEYKVTDIYIVTDGEVFDAQASLGKVLKELYDSHPIRLFLVTVEANNHNYLSDNVNAGNNLFNVVKYNSLTPLVKDFMCFNMTHTNITQPYYNLHNPDVPEGFIPFRNQYFKVTKLPTFIEHLETLVNTPNQNLERLVFDLTITSYHLVKEKPPFIQKQIVELLACVFEGTEMEQEAKNKLKNELKNHQFGKSSTYQEYRTRRGKLFERGYQDITENVKLGINKVMSSHYYTFPVPYRDVENNTTNYVVYGCNSLG